MVLSPPRAPKTRGGTATRTVSPSAAAEADDGPCRPLVHACDRLDPNHEILGSADGTEDQIVAAYDRDQVPCGAGRDEIEQGRFQIGLEVRSGHIPMIGLAHGGRPETSGEKRPSGGPTGPIPEDSRVRRRRGGILPGVLSSPPEGLHDQLRRLYGLEPIAIEHVHHGLNDTYRVQLADSRCYLRVYAADGYYGITPDQFRFELELVAHLHGHGLPVPCPIRTRDGRLLSELEADGQTRPASLLKRVVGAPHQAWWPRIRDASVVRALGTRWAGASCSTSLSDCSARD